MLIQLNPSVPLESPKGKCNAFFLIDLGEEHSLMWVTFLEESGECWTFRNEEIRLQKNYTMRPKSFG